MPHCGLFLWALIHEPSAIFGMVCKSLSSLTVCVYNSKLYACIYLNIPWLLWWMRMADASTYVERSNRNLHKSMICWSCHIREGRSQQSSLVFIATWTRSACWKQSWFWQSKGVFLTLSSNCHWVIVYPLSLGKHWDILTKVCYILFIKTL